MSRRSPITSLPSAACGTDTSSSCRFRTVTIVMAIATAVGRATATLTVTGASSPAPDRWKLLSRRTFLRGVLRRGRPRGCRLVVRRRQRQNYRFRVLLKRHLALEDPAEQPAPLRIAQLQPDDVVRDQIE